MALVILLASLGGNDFSLIPGQLLECTDKEADSLVEASQARRLLDDEPSALQTSTKFTLPVTVPALVFNPIPEPGNAPEPDDLKNDADPDEDPSPDVDPPADPKPEAKPSPKKPAKR